jgi:hypothetical protein
MRVSLVSGTGAGISLWCLAPVCVCLTPDPDVGVWHWWCVCLAPDSDAGVWHRCVRLWHPIPMRVSGTGVAAGVWHRCVCLAPDPDAGV